jgi:integrase
MRNRNRVIAAPAASNRPHPPKPQGFWRCPAFSGHSLRSGFATSAARAGVPEAQIQTQTGHKSLPVLRGYIRRGSLFRDNAAGKLGL